MNIKNNLFILFTAIYSATSFANVIVDTKGVDMEKYNADMYECQQLSTQVQSNQVDSVGRDVVGSTARTAALGAAGTAIAGGHGSKGAKVGAGVGLVGGLLHHRADAQYSEAKYQHDVESVMKQCMVGRGYNVLN
ncbi:glycine zipper family protein [Vibrio mediterranei]|uniref:glycine zipper family protein n=1 Tax=Vibrio mediterranei TaxID=689 RepID=UPI00148D275B|nr:glycine zipper family protein [Vibrio mediterranei]NOI22232.1 glycine zipper family protein [Vibrio mediterranei]